MVFASLTKEELLNITKGFKVLSKHSDKSKSGIATHMKFLTTIYYYPSAPTGIDAFLDVMITNLDIEISRAMRMTLPAVSSSVVNSVNTKIFFECLIPMTVIDFAKSLPNDTDVIEFTSLSGDWTSFTVSSGASIVKFNGVDPIYFPKKNSKSLIKTLDIPPDSLYNLLRGVTHVSVPAEKATKTFCSGINIKGDHGHNMLIFTATDSYRVAETSMSHPINADFEFTIPHETALILSEIVKNESSMISVHHAAGMVSFTTPDTEFIASLLATSFPDCQKFMVINSKYNLEFNNQEFIASVKQMRIFSKEERCIMEVKPNQINLEIKDDVIPMVVNEVHNAVLLDSTGVSKDSFSTAFVTSFVLNHLERLSPESSPYWSFQDGDTPSILVGEMDEDITSRYLVVPLKP